jgi:hypothetical protein
MDSKARTPTERPPEKDREVRPRDSGEAAAAARTVEQLEAHRRGFDDATGTNPDRGQARIEPEADID